MSDLAILRQLSCVPEVYGVSDANLWNSGFPPDSRLIAQNPTREKSIQGKASVRSNIQTLVSPIRPSSDTNLDRGIYRRVGRCIVRDVHRERQHLGSTILMHVRKTVQVMGGSGHVIDELNIDNYFAGGLSCNCL